MTAPKLAAEGYRKLLVALLAELGAIVLAGMGIVSGAEFLEFSKWIVGIYAAANVGEWFSRSRQPPSP